MQRWSRGPIGDKEKGLSKDFGIGLMCHALVKVDVLNLYIRTETEIGSSRRQRFKGENRCSKGGFKMQDGRFS